MQTRLEPELLRAYRETDYRVAAEPPFVLRVGSCCAELQHLHRRHGVDCSAFMTACNPYSRLFDSATNAQRQAALENELKRRSLHFLAGLGQHPGNGWTGEESFLILGLTLEAARKLGREFEQNAFVWSGADAVPQLVLLV
jgi:sugar phosphate isomerase/epimerase